MKDQIIQLRNEGKSYREICRLLGCSKGTVSYHCGKDQKEKTRNRTQKSRQQNSLLKKVDNFKQTSPLKSPPSILLKARVDKWNQNEKTFYYKDVLEKFNPKCYLSGRDVDFTDSRSYSLDHIIPVSKGGSNTLDNMGVTCREANQAKSDLLIPDLLKLCEDILKNHGYEIKPPSGRNTSAPTRTGNLSLEAKDDILFTTEA